MRVFLNDGPAHLQIVSRAGIRDFHDVGAAVDFLRPLAAEPRNVEAMRRAIGDAVFRTDEELVEELARRIVSEGLQIVSCADTFFASLRNEATASASSQATTTPLEDEEAAKEEKKAAAQPEETHWIEIELVDDAGVPVADEMYLVELPDGSKLTGRTDAKGRARVENVDPGTAKVTFPDMDKDAYTPK